MGLIANSFAGFGRWLLKQYGQPVPQKVQGVLSTQVRTFDEVYGHSQGREGFAKLIKRYVSWVYACASINATSVASVPLRLYVSKQSNGQKFLAQTKKVSSKQKDYLFAEPTLQYALTKAVDVEEVVEHPFLDLMEQVNPYSNGFDLLENWILFQELTGNCYTLMVKNGLQTPTELWVLPAQQIKIIPSREQMIAAYVLGDDPATQQRFEPDEIIHMKYPNPDDMFYGKGPLAAAVLAADTHSGMADHEYNLLRNSAIPPAALSTEQVLTADQLKTIKDEWNAAYRGTGKAGKMAVLQGGLKIENIALSPKEMGYLMGQQIKREEIAAIFGVPMSLLTVEDIAAAPATGMIMGNISYSRRTILPKCRRIQEKLNEQLIPLYDEKLFVAFDNPVPEDEVGKTAKREANLRMGFTTINEEREEANLESVPWGDRPWMPFNLQQVGSANRANPNQQIAEERTTHSSPSLPRGGVRNEHSAPCACPEHKQAEGLDAETLPPAYIRLANVTRKMFRLQKEETIQNMPAKGLTKALGEEWLPSTSKWVSWLVHNSKPIILELVGSGGDQAARQLGGDFTFSTGDPAIEAFIDQYAYKFSFAVHEETLAELRDQLKQGFQGDETLVGLRQRIANTFDDMADYRAERIGRTEAVRALNAGQEQGWIQSGVVVGKEWLAVSDSCEFCKTMEAMYGPGTGGIPLLDSFIKHGQEIEGISGGKMQARYSAIDLPPVHPNCRCTITAVLKE